MLIQPARAPNSRSPDEVPPALTDPIGTPPSVSLRARKAASPPILTFWRAALSQLVREEQEQLLRKRAGREDARRAWVAAEVPEVGAEAAAAVVADLPPPQASYLPLHVMEARLEKARRAWLAEAAVAEAVVTADAAAQTGQGCIVYRLYTV